MHTLPAWAADLPLVLTDAAWHSVLIAVAVAAICRLAGDRLSATWRFALWGVVFARLAIPVGPASVLSAMTWLPNPLASAGGRLAPVARLEPARKVSSRTVAVRQTAGPVEAVETEVSALATARAPARRDAPIPDRKGSLASPGGSPSTELVWRSGWAMLLVSWSVGVLLLLSRQIVSALRLHRNAATWDLITHPDIAEMLDQCRRLTRVKRRVRCYASDDPLGPATLGIARPRIVLPRRLLDSLASDQLRLLLLHELSHIRRNDVLWDRCASLLAAIYWFNPAAWWARCKMRDEREQACDATVLQCCGHDAAAMYGRLLLGVAQRDAGRNWPLPVVGAMSGKRSMQRRIEMMGRQQNGPQRSFLYGTAALLLVAFCGLTSAQVQQVPRDAESAVSAEGEAPPALWVGTAGPYRIDGICRDGEGQPLPGVMLHLFRVDRFRSTRQSVARVQSPANGAFRFDSLPRPPVDEDGSSYRSYYVLAATKAGRASYLKAFSGAASKTEGLEIGLPAAASISGRVADGHDNPVVGASVIVRSYPAHLPIDGVLSTTTDAEGRYTISDVAAWNPTQEAPLAGTGGEYLAREVSRNFRVLHPHYAAAIASYARAPAKVDVMLEVGATIRGVIRDEVTGRPADGVTVSMQGIQAGGGWANPTGWMQTTTDAEGNYEFSSARAGSYNVWAEAPDRSCRALDSLTVAAGGVYPEQNIQLVEGGWIEGRIVDVATGLPLTQWNGQRLHIGLHGPSRPRSGAAVQSTLVDDNGRFGIRVAPGTNYPYIMAPEVWRRAREQRQFEAGGVDVASGELAIVDFHVLPQRARQDPSSAALRLPIPVASERSAAAAIRRLGGWYQVGESGHVVDVNMVYHNAGGVRYDNEQTDTDEALRIVPAFPHLNRLLLKEGQATDENMRFVAELSDLEVFFAWDAAKLSDAGVRHLMDLKKLRTIHIGQSGLTDESMSVFAALPQLERLTLQGNRFSNAALEQLSDSTQLQSLVIGNGSISVDDEGLVHLKRLVNLTRLGLQSSKISDAGLEHLTGLTKLKTLWVGSTKVTPAGFAALAERLPLLEDGHKYVVPAR